MNTHAESDLAVLCAPPDATPHPPRHYALPAGSVDTHAHVIGDAFIPNRSYTPPPASASAYLDMLDAVGMTYGVLIQVSVHGTDNSLMTTVLKSNSQRLRGVAVAAHDAPAATWQTLRDAGVVGLRLNAASGGGVGLSHLDHYEAIARDLGWHLQILVNAESLAPDTALRLSKLRVPFIMDHMGYFHVGNGLSSPGAKLMLELMEDGAWVKLSGAFRLSDRPDYLDTLPFAQALIEAAPDRCVWGSDWPHVSFKGRMPNIGDLLDLLYEWSPNEAGRNRILVDNPARLYGFPPVSGI
jgi:2-pyrone-4,6-dicarboxylate lactonase